MRSKDTREDSDGDKHGASEADAFLLQFNPGYFLQFLQKDFLYIIGEITVVVVFVSKKLKKVCHKGWEIKKKPIYIQVVERYKKMGDKK